MNVLDQHRTPNLLEVILMGLLAGLLLIIAGSLLALLSGCSADAHTKITPATSNVTSEIHRRTIEIEAAPQPTPTATQPADIPATTVRKVWRVTWTEPTE